MFRRANQEPLGAGFRFADMNERWIVLERDRDATHQELLVLGARDGTEVLRTDGMALPPDARQPVSQTWDMTMRPYLSGDTLLTFRPGEALVALAIPSGREQWRVPLPSALLLERALTVTPTHIAWVDAQSGLRVFEASTGRLLWRASLRPCVPGGCVALEPDGSASALTWDWELVSWDARGVEQTRVPLAPDWGTHTLLRRHDLAVLLGSSARVVDVRAGRALTSSTASERGTTGAFVGDELLLASDRGVIAAAPRTLTPRWRSPVRGRVGAATPEGLAVLGENGVLSWLDVRTGTTRFAIGVGEPTLRHLYRGRPSWGVASRGSRAEPAILPSPTGALAPPRPRGDTLVLQDARGGFVAFATAPAARSSRRTVTGVVRLNGRGRSGLQVHVGDGRVRTTRGGRFRAAVTLPGTVRVSVDSSEIERSAQLPCAREVRAVVDLATQEPVLLDAFAADYDCDGACTCD